MCLGIPGRVVETDAGRPEFAVVDVAGVTRTIDTSLIGRLEPGDWVVVHVGFALSRLDADEAKALLDMLEITPQAGRA